MHELSAEKVLRGALTQDTHAETTVLWIGTPRWRKRSNTETLIINVLRNRELSLHSGVRVMRARVGASSRVDFGDLQPIKKWINIHAHLTAFYLPADNAVLTYLM